MLELYNLFIHGTKAASSDCVQTNSLHLAEARGLFYKKKRYCQCCTDCEKSVSAQIALECTWIHGVMLLRR